MAQANTCPFCDPGTRVVAGNDQAVAVRDAHPVSPGHTLVLPRRHVADWWGATRSERAAIDALLRTCKEDLDRQFSPAGYNVGINNGAAAGQTVFHLHVHLIPRYEGDNADPRGGVRHVIPGLGNYLRSDSPAERATATVEGGDLMQRLLSVLQEGRRSATYKPALLLALTELAQERADGGAALTLPLDDVAERVMAYYWPQTRPYPDQPGPLRQGSSPNLRIPDALLALRRTSSAGPSAALSQVRVSHPEAYLRARHKTARALARQPVPRLQRPGGHPAQHYRRFLYDDSRFVAERGALDDRPTITLLPGVAEALARSAGIIRIAAQDIWVDEVAGFNGLRLDEADLHDFLFGVDRRSMRRVADGLRDAGIGSCFWCHRPLGRAVEVDHVIPWSHLAHDDLSNLVLADRSCNNDKRDRLVTADLLRRWLHRDPTAPREVAAELQWPFDPARSRAVARTSYRYLAAGMPLWRGRRTTVPLDERQRRTALRLIDAAA
jgi:diadenosine tetraphosphate (Ap4A) HIT family hydrolase